MGRVEILESIFPGNSEMAQLMRAFDWSSTEVGLPEKEEQREIVRRLEAADAVIAALEEKQIRVRRLSRSLVENLVTGHLRIADVTVA